MKRWRGEGARGGGVTNIQLQLKKMHRCHLLGKDHMLEESILHKSNM